MSSHNYSAVPPPLPPPPPANVSGQGQPSPGRGAAAVRPEIITQGTTFAQAHGNLQTPASATASSPFSPFTNHSSSSYAPSPVASSPMAAPYNPQQWRGNGRPGVQYAPQQTQMAIHPVRPQDLSGHEEAMPSPPPPYTPAHAQNQNISQALSLSPGHAFAQSRHPHPSTPQSSTPSSARAARSFHSRPVSIAIPSGSAAAPLDQFAPPPVAPSRERSSSRGLSNKFSLSNFRNRNNDQSPAPSAIESLHLSTHDALQRGDSASSSQRSFAPYTPSPLDRRHVPDTQSPLRAPNARRAASAGVLGHGTETRTPIDETPPNIPTNWGPGMPLPPPPPGPPPSNSRSQSVGPGFDSDRSSGYPSAPPTRRPGQTTLGPIPPTPMGWEDEPASLPAPPLPPPPARSPAAHGLYVDTSQHAARHHEHAAPPPEPESESTVSGPSMTSHSGSGSTLSRPRREGSARGSIRERREESRAARERRAEPSNNPWAHDLEVSTSKANFDLASPESGLSRRGAVTKNTPRSGGTLRSPRSAHLYDDPGSANSTPRIITGPRAVSAAAPTPPFSPGTEHLPHQKAPAAFPAKALPTPPLHSVGDNLGLTTPSGVGNRSVSQTSLHSVSTPHNASLHPPGTTDRDVFAKASIERHRAFIEKEMYAETDEERLELFAEFFVAESRLRRDRYASAFDAIGAGEVMDLSRDLWRSYKTSGRRAVTPSAQVTPSYPGNKRAGSMSGESPDTRPSDSMPTTAASPASSRGQFTPHTEPASPSSASSQRARDAPWSNNYHPSLSPIPSMAMSTIPDEEGSRGRSASRWWESDDGSQGVGGRRLERTKRESKYMGLVMESQESFHQDGQEQPTPKFYRASSSSRPAVSRADEYPPEKTGLHDGKGKQPAYDYFPSPTPPAIDPHKLDVSRLVTLPPPYPRHHPAVNNNHPDLASIRSSLRTLTAVGDVKTTKASFAAKTETRKESENASLNDRRAQIRYNIQENLRNGQMSFQDAAKADKEFEAREHQRAQNVVQNTFDTFQTEVANTLHAMLCERVTKVTASIEHLKGRLSNEAQELNPNQTQEEGDEKPELLEMLTLLKWLFELREQLHKELFELENERNDLYRDIIVLPYLQAKNDQKVKEASEFFRHDAQDRKVTFEKDIIKRYEEFLEVIERNVTRGVETQLSAFWDIAPGLLAIVQKVPHRLDGFGILIPMQEYSENPAYNDFPLQYLYTLLAHAGRSAYQFIESQINLLCLLHEVKTAVMTAGSRLLETQRLLEGEDMASVDAEMIAIRADEEQRLTDDLKEKVALVESQWNEALGQGLKDCKKQVEEFLNEQGGWDDSLSE